MADTIKYIYFTLLCFNLILCLKNFCFEQICTYLFFQKDISNYVTDCVFTSIVRTGIGELRNNNNYGMKLNNYDLFYYHIIYLSYIGSFYKRKK